MNPTLKTGVLLASLTALLVIIGYFISGRGGAILFFMISIIINIVSFLFSDRIAIAMSGANPLEESQAPQIYQDIRELSQKMDLPMPRVYFTNDVQPNAFATGKGPSSGVVCITQGLLNVLNREEVRGVIAHELAHIKNRDVLISTIAAVLAGAVSSVAQIGLYFGGSGDDDNRNPIFQLLLVLFAPIAATIIQLSISRAREYEADATAAKYTGRPQDLANVLIKIEQTVRQVPTVQANPALASLFIQNPFSGAGLIELFSTHPSTEKRVEKLLAMAQ